jgi:hypothetical protein
MDIYRDGLTIRESGLILDELKCRKEWATIQQREEDRQRKEVKVRFDYSF